MREEARSENDISKETKQKKEKFSKSERRRKENEQDRIYRFFFLVCV